MNVVLFHLQRQVKTGIYKEKKLVLNEQIPSQSSCDGMVNVHIWKCILSVKDTYRC